MDREELYDVFETMSLADVIRLQDHLSQLLRRRFGRDLGLIFTDIVGSTKYFNQFGDEAGRRLQQRHIDTLEEVLARHGGRIVDTAGDGAFCAVPSAQSGALTLIDVMNLVDEQNVNLETPHMMHLRCGLHWGQVLTNGEVVTGDSVNLAARIAGSARIDEIRLSRAAFTELANTHRLRCRPLGATELKGLTKPVDLFTLDWLDHSLFPGFVYIEETGQKIALPNKPTITFGRLGLHDGISANDIVLTLDDPTQSRQISRWHFELRRSPKGYVLRPVSRGRTEVDGVVVERGSEVPIAAGSIVKLSRVITLSFRAGHSIVDEGARATMFAGD
ncbi:MAG: adenylate/guanylate cyclase domain-containing protein [Myxococcales bacterium]|nr:adenylate/guanylate cyclase domain-containing protein [Myxococcales bacterium]MCB9670362.1 adenylate/guanylate cyclase domain-containing protein [Alphaproteobacteria bacterium]MCB9693383.1 adenylate/guanylate cyclase domain-containing protein [Alphaproteobacteria bacterium]